MFVLAALTVLRTQYHHQHHRCHHHDHLPSPSHLQPVCWYYDWDFGRFGDLLLATNVLSLGASAPLRDSPEIAPITFK